MYLILLFASLAFAQRPEFEVAVVKPSAPTGVGGFKMAPNGSVVASHTTMRMYLQWAYNVPEVSGPRWIDEEFYDISAKAAEPAQLGQLKLMFQALLEDRFQLRVHRETKDTSTMALVVAKSGVRNLPEAGGKFEVQRDGGVVVFKNASMGNVASVLASPFGNMPLERVVDQTGLRGVYDLTLDLKAFDRNDPAFGGSYQEMRNSLSVFVSDVLEKQYGLKLERRKVPTDFLVVDIGNKVPSEN